MKKTNYYDDERRATWAMSFLLLGSLLLVIGYPCAPVRLMDHGAKDLAIEQVQGMNSVNWPGVWP